MRYLMMSKKAVFAAALLFCVALPGSLALTGVLPWGTALQAAGLGALGAFGDAGQFSNQGGVLTVFGLKNPWSPGRQ
jgi:hypothetical protein